MSSLDFITLWRAQPFRPFRVHMQSGIVFDVVQAQQVGISPGLGLLVVVVADDRFEVLLPEQVAACAVITDAMPAIPLAAPMVTGGGSGGGTATELSPGKVQLMAFTGKDGRGMVQFVVSDRDGNPMLSSAGTRWDLHGIETFENGRSLYIHHADDPTLIKRIIVWPPISATLDSFAEAKPAAELLRELRELDAKATAEPHEVPLAKDYIKSVDELWVYTPPPTRGSGRENEPDDELRFEVGFRDHEVGPHHWAKSPRLTDTLVDVPMLDLTESQWDADVSQNGDELIFRLRHFPDGQHHLEFRTEPLSGMARVNGNELPLTVLEWHLRNFELYNHWESLVAALAQAPALSAKPRVEAALAGPGGFVIELWPGEARWPLPFLSPRITAPSGKTILDLRGSVWSSLVQWAGPNIRLHLINADPKERSEVPLRLDINPCSQRVTSDFIPGCTVLAALQVAAHQCRTASWMLEELRELFARGRDLPLP